MIENNDRIIINGKLIAEGWSATAIVLVGLLILVGAGFVAGYVAAVSP